MKLELLEGSVNGVALDLSHLIGMYRLSGGNGLNAVFPQALKSGDPSTRYQIALLLGDSLPAKRAELLLIQMLDDSKFVERRIAVNFASAC